MKDTKMNKVIVILKYIAVKIIYPLIRDYLDRR